MLTATLKVHLCDKNGITQCQNQRQSPRRGGMCSNVVMLAAEGFDATPEAEQCGTCRKNRQKMLAEKAGRPTNVKVQYADEIFDAAVIYRPMGRVTIKWAMKLHGVQCDMKMELMASTVRMAVNRNQPLVAAAR